MAMGADSPAKNTVHVFAAFAFANVYCLRFALKASEATCLYLFRRSLGKYEDQD